jgi:arylsulfatase
MARQVPIVVLTARTEVGKLLATFKEFPPRQRATSFSADQHIDQMQKNLSVTAQ